MKLIRLTEQEYKKIGDKRFCLVEKSPSYLKELSSLYSVFERLDSIVDDNPRNQGIWDYSRHSIEVQPLSALRNMDFQDTVIVITSDYYKEYFEKIQLLLGDRDMDVYFFPNQETAYELEYREKYADSKLQDILVFRSGPHASGYVRGMDFDDNARALFEYALSLGLNDKYELVWIVKNPEEFKKYSAYNNVSFLPFDGSVSENKAVRDDYYRVLCLAKFFFFTDAYGFVRNCREDQVRVQLWHGSVVKKRLSPLPCKSRYEYMTVTGEFFAKLCAEEFGLEDSQMLVTGLPKMDWLFEQDQSVFEKLGLKKTDKTIFWMPTYRFSEKRMNKPIDGVLNEETGLPLLKDRGELEQINRILEERNILLIIKLHPFQDKSVVHTEGLSNIVLLDNEALYEQGIQINRILGMADALISDYSSSAIDFLILDRPIAILVDDVEDYSESRGYLFDNILEALPGTLISDLCGLERFIEEIAEGHAPDKEKRGLLLERYHKYKDNLSSKRVLEALKII